MKQGDIVGATITEITDYGFFLDSNDERILILITEISWGRVHNTNDFGCIGERIDVLILRYVAENSLYLGSIKQLSPESNPWRDESFFAVGQIFEGKVQTKTSYGTFVLLAKYVEGLLRNEDGGKDLLLGQKVMVRVVELTPEIHKIRLETFDTSL